MNTPTPQADALSKIDVALQVVADLCEGRKRWTMNIPARVDEDPDLVIAGALQAAREAISAQRVAETAEPQTDDAARDVLAERQRQITAEGWTPEHDDEHCSGELALAAGCYAISGGNYGKGIVPPIWPWGNDSWKPTYGRRDLVRAGALIIAEIERIDRAAIAASPTKEPTP